MHSVYVIRQDGERWLIFAGDSCILVCDDGETARRTVADAEVLLCEWERLEEAAA